MDSTRNGLDPSESREINNIVDRLKKQGLFDKFRKECLADVDTKPAYQNLRYRVEGAVGRFLLTQKWHHGVNKNHLRDCLRRHMHELPMLSNGVDHIVEQVVNPKVYTDFKPQIDRMVCEHLGMDYDLWKQKLKLRDDMKDEQFRQEQQMLHEREHPIEQPVQDPSFRSPPPAGFSTPPFSSPGFGPGIRRLMDVNIRDSPNPAGGTPNSSTQANVSTAVPSVPCQPGAMGHLPPGSAAIPQMPASSTMLPMHAGPPVNTALPPPALPQQINNPGGIPVQGINVSYPPPPFGMTVPFQFGAYQPTVPGYPAVAPFAVPGTVPASFPQPGLPMTPEKSPSVAGAPGHVRMPDAIINAFKVEGSPAQAEYERQLQQEWREREKEKEREKEREKKKKLEPLTVEDLLNIPLPKPPPEKTEKRKKVKEESFKVVEMEVVEEQVVEEQEVNLEEGVMTHAVQEEVDPHPPQEEVHQEVEEEGKVYHFAWDDAEEDSGQLSDVTISSVHTSDLSFFEEDAVVEESMEMTAAGEDNEADDGDASPDNATQGMNTSESSPEKTSTSMDQSGSSPVKLRRGKLLSLQYNYTDSEDDETREERKARIAEEKESRYKLRVQRRAAIEARKRDREEVKQKRKEEKQEKAEQDVESGEDVPEECPSPQADEPGSPVPETPETPVSTPAKSIGSPMKSVDRRPKRTKQELKEQLREQKVLEKKMALRRQRTRNKKYVNEDFTSIFTNSKLGGDSYVDQVEMVDSGEVVVEDSTVIMTDDTQVVYSEDVESSKGEQYVYLATENVNVTEEQTSDADIMNTEDANDGSGDSTPYSEISSGSLDGEDKSAKSSKRTKKNKEGMSLSPVKAAGNDSVQYKCPDLPEHPALSGPGRQRIKRMRQESSSDTSMSVASSSHSDTDSTSSTSEEERQRRRQRIRRRVKAKKKHHRRSPRGEKHTKHRSPSSSRDSHQMSSSHSRSRSRHDRDDSQLSASEEQYSAEEHSDNYQSKKKVVRKQSLPSSSVEREEEGEVSDGDGSASQPPRSQSGTPSPQRSESSDDERNKRPKRPLGEISFGEAARQSFKRQVNDVDFGEAAVRAQTGVFSPTEAPPQRPPVKTPTPRSYRGRKQLTVPQLPAAREVTQAFRGDLLPTVRSMSSKGFRAWTKGRVGGDTDTRKRGQDPDTRGRQRGFAGDVEERLTSFASPSKSRVKGFDTAIESRSKAFPPEPSDLDDWGYVPPSPEPPRSSSLPKQYKKKDTSPTRQREPYVTTPPSKYSRSRSKESPERSVSHRSLSPDNNSRLSSSPPRSKSPGSPPRDRVRIRPPLPPLDYPPSQLLRRGQKLGKGRFSPSPPPIQRRVREPSPPHRFSPSPPPIQRRVREPSPPHRMSSWSGPRTPKSPLSSPVGYSSPQSPGQSMSPPLPPWPPQDDYDVDGGSLDGSGFDRVAREHRSRSSRRHGKEHKKPPSKKLRSSHK